MTLTGSHLHIMGVMKMLRNKKRRRLAVENLEGRRLMAGDVTVDFNGEKLEIKGDDLPNQIAVFARDGNLIVDGLGTTTINGISDGTGTNLGPAAGLIDIVIETFGLAASSQGTVSKSIRGSAMTL